MADNRQTRRYPHNLQGVLQLAVEAGSAAEGPAPSEPMSEEVSKTEINKTIKGPQKALKMLMCLTLTCKGMWNSRPITV